MTVATITGSKHMGSPTSQGPFRELALHTLGWKSFQDLCAHIVEDVLKRPVEIFREAQDGGQDGVFWSRRVDGATPSNSATLQCKFTSKPNAHISASELSGEEEAITELVSRGEARTYVLMTNKSASGPNALAIKQHLRQLGVLHPHVFGREFITRTIMASSKLRALVPRVYGLGDLSIILDERRADQTKALLGHMLSTLNVYVPTEAHINAVRALSEHGIVLLLGDPATGKSTIAAILAAMATDEDSHSCFRADGPDDLPENWNPNQNSGLFWVDDAFGPNQMREDYVDRWITIMPKIQAAMSLGNKFILTSRTHIYQAARIKLGSRNHPLFRQEKAVVNVGATTPEERRQILYNHIKMGNQSSIWKSRVKPQLDALSREDSLLPEIARRLGDSAYTSNLSTAHDSLLKFIREPKEHLVQTILELSKALQAALTLIFIQRGRMSEGSPSETMKELIIKHFGIDAQSLGEALQQLVGSFLAIKIEHNERFWTYKHPTISDAIGAILGANAGMLELYLRGTKSETILTEASCKVDTEIPDAIVIPAHLYPVLAERIAETPDDKPLNNLLFRFLGQRSSDDFFRFFVSMHPALLCRDTYRFFRVVHDQRLRVLAKAHRIGFLSTELRIRAAAEIEYALFEDFDASFLSDDEILSLIQPTEVLNLSDRLEAEFFESISWRLSETVDEADLDVAPEDNFSDFSSAISDLERVFQNANRIKTKLESIASQIDDAVDSVSQKKREREEERQRDDDWDWDNYSPARPSRGIQGKSESVRRQSRSIFSDLDE